MSATPPPGYTPPPADLPQRGDRATFSNRVDAWVTWFSTVILTQLAAMVANAYANALDAFASATSAIGAKTASEAARDAAQGYRDTALTYRDAAQAAQVAAETARDAAQNYAAALTATSTTSLVIGVGTKIFTTQAGKQFTANQTLKAVNPGNAAQWMVGTVAYSGTTLTMTVTDVNPATSGNTVANWVIGLSGEKGATGATGGVTGGNLTGSLNEKQGPNVAFSATTDIWSGVGNSLRLDGTGTVTGFPNAPQAGAKRTLLIGAGPIVLQQSAAMTVYGGTQTVTVGDQVDVVALESVGLFYVDIRRHDGTPTVGAKQYVVVLTSGSSWTVDATSFEVEVQAGGQGGRGAQDSYLRGSDAGWCGVKRFRDAVVGSTAVIAIGGAGAVGTDTTNAGSGGTTSFTLSGFTALTATFTGATGADISYPGQKGGASISSFMGPGGDSRNGFGAATSGGALAGSGYGAGGSGGTLLGGAGTAGCIIIRYFK